MQRYLYIRRKKTSIVLISAINKEIVLRIQLKYLKYKQKELKKKKVYNSKPKVYVKEDLMETESEFQNLKKKDDITKVENMF